MSEDCGMKPAPNNFPAPLDGNACGFFDAKEREAWTWVPSEDLQRLKGQYGSKTAEWYPSLEVGSRCMGVKGLERLFEACKMSYNAGIAAITKEEAYTPAADKHTREECHKKRTAYEYGKLVGKPVQIWCWVWCRGVKVPYMQGIFDFGGCPKTAYIGGKMMGIDWEDILDGTHWIEEGGPLPGLPEHEFVDVPREGE